MSSVTLHGNPVHVGGNLPAVGSHAPAFTLVATDLSEKALVEAMSCGLPAVASRVGGVPGIVDHLDNGVLVEPGDPELLAWSVIALLEQPDLRRAIGARARETACRRFSIRAVAEQHFDLFRSLCS